MPSSGTSSACGPRIASTAIALDREQSECAGTLDDYSRILATGGGTGTIEEYRQSSPYQAQTIADLGRADVAVVAASDLQRWSEVTLAVVEERFPLVTQVGDYQVRRSR